MKTNVADQRGWLVLSPSAEQMVVHTGHAVEEADPDLVIDAILDVYDQAGALVLKRRRGLDQARAGLMIVAASK